MARGVQLQQLVLDLRAELGHSLSVSHGAASEDTLKYQLRRTQKELYEFYDWPSKMEYATISLHAGNRYYDYPTSPIAIDMDQVNGVWVRHGNQWQRVTEGITPLDYNAENPDSDERSWPVRKYRHSPANDQMEVWPIPSTSGTLLIYGKVQLGALTANDDTCDLDDTAIVLACAASMLDELGDKRAPKIQTRSTQYINKLINNQVTDKKTPFVFGGSEKKQLRAGLDYIPQGYTG